MREYRVSKVENIDGIPEVNQPPEQCEGPIASHPERVRVLIFLDVDGVLNSMRSIVAFRGCREQDLDPVAIRLLDRLCVGLTDAGYSPEVVISSTWRMLRPRLRWWADLWAFHNCIAIRTVGMTPIFNDNNPHRRGREVAEWLQANGNGDPYVCLDDDSDFMPGQPLEWMDPAVGLQIADINAAHRVLTGKAMAGLPRIILDRDGGVSRPPPTPMTPREGEAVAEGQPNNV